MVVYRPLLVHIQSLCVSSQNWCSNQVIIESDINIPVDIKNDSFRNCFIIFSNKLTNRLTVLPFLTPAPPHVVQKAIILIVLLNSTLVILSVYCPKSFCLLGKEDSSSAELCPLVYSAD